MKSITKFLLVMSSFAPFAAGAAGPVSQTAGNNLTGYNGAMGSVVGNQWNNATNPRINMQNTNVKADYGNCNAVILRCAKPKCSGGGCSNADVAKPIVAGCVNANATCKQHGDGLIDYISAQLVADSVAEANRQASASAAAASEQNAQQIAQMQQQMSQQMQMMQEQNNAQIASLQNALAESQRATAEAVQAAAAQQSRAAPVADVETGLTANQQAAAKSGVSEDTITRATITGQILTSMEGVDASLNKLKTIMRDAFKYGGCNTINGNNCSGPKRVKKFRELANKFFEPYDALSDNLEDALLKAQSVGVDLGNIYMFFSGTCNRWAEYVCRGDYTKVYRESPGYSYEVTGQNNLGLPVMTGETRTVNQTCDPDTHKSIGVDGIRGGHDCYAGQVVPPEDLVACSVNKFLDPENDADKVTEKILNPDETTSGGVRVGCASDLSTGLIKRRRSSSKKGGVDIDLLEIMITQNEGGTKKLNDEAKKLCGLWDDETATSAITALKTATISKSLGKKCCEKPGTCNVDCYDMSKDVSYVDPLFALCDTHAWNINETNDDVKSGEIKEQMKEVIGLKTTVIAQQMYKQYSELETMLKQLKIMLEKEVLKSNLKVASGTSDSNDDSSSSTSNEFANCDAYIEDEEVLNCIRGNYSKLQPYVEKKNIKNSVKKQIAKDSALLAMHGVPNKNSLCTKEGNITSNSISKCFGALQEGIINLNKQVSQSKKSGSGLRLGIIQD